MHPAFKGAAVLLFLGGCSNPFDEPKPVQNVHQTKPVYCYQSLADVRCHSAPKFVDKNRIVNFYGPSPKRFTAPPPVASPDLKAPKPVDFWVKDAEPIPEPALKKAGRRYLPTE